MRADRPVVSDISGAVRIPRILRTHRPQCRNALNFELERASSRLLFHTADHRAGTDAFLTKPTPSYPGR